MSYKHHDLSHCPWCGSPPSLNSETRGDWEYTGLWQNYWVGCRFKGCHTRSTSFQEIHTERGGTKVGVKNPNEAAVQAWRDQDISLGNLTVILPKQHYIVERQAKPNLTNWDTHNNTRLVIAIPMSHGKKMLEMFSVVIDRLPREHFFTDNYRERLGVLDDRHIHPYSFTLREGDFGSYHTVVLKKVYRYSTTIMIEFLVKYSHLSHSLFYKSKAKPDKHWLATEVAQPPINERIYEMLKAPYENVDD